MKHACMQCRTLFLSGIVLFVLISSVRTSSEMWSQTYGGEHEDIAYSLVEASDGGFAIAGWRRPSWDKHSDFLLVKTDAYGNMEWNQTYGGGGHHLTHSLVETSDGGYAIAGETSSFGAGRADFWLVRTNPVVIPKPQPQPIEPFPTWVVATIAIIAVVGVALLVYFAKVKKPTGEEKRTSPEGVM